MCTLTCQLISVSYLDGQLFYHTLFNAFPYSFPFGVSPSGDVVPCAGLPFDATPRSQVEIASLLEPDWILVDIGANDVGYAASAGLDFPPVDPDDFDADYRAMMTKLRTDNPDSVIICGNVADPIDSARFATPAGADALLAQGPFGVGGPRPPSYWVASPRMTSSTCGRLRACTA